MNVLEAALEAQAQVAQTPIGGHRIVGATAGMEPPRSGLSLQDILLLGASALEIGSYLYSLWQDAHAQPDMEDENVIERQETLEALQKRAAALEHHLWDGTGMEELRTNTRSAQQRIEKYRHEMFAPDSMEQLREAIAQAEDMESRGTESIATNAWYQAAQLARIIEKQVLEGEMAWEAKCISYLEQRNGFCEAARSCGEFPLEFITSEGRETVQVDVDYWTQGTVSALLQELPPREVSRDCTIGQLRDFSQQVEQLDLALQGLLQQANNAFENSQLRRETYEDVYSVFLDRGWRLDETQENGFESDDIRRDMHLTLRNPSGDRLRFDISGNGTINVEIGLSGVYNTSMRAYLADILHQVMEENQFTVDQITDAI